MGQGCNAVYSASGYDKSIFLKIASTLEELLSRFYEILSQGRYYWHKDNLTYFRMNP